MTHPGLVNFLREVEPSKRLRHWKTCEWPHRSIRAVTTFPSKGKRKRKETVKKSCFSEEKNNFQNTSKTSLLPKHLSAANIPVCSSGPSRALVGVMVLFFWARQFSLTVIFPTQEWLSVRVYEKWEGGKPAILSRGMCYIPNRVILQRPG